MDNNLPCPYCSSNKGFIYIQSHYQCLSCKRVVDDCCNGEIATDEVLNFKVKESK